MITETLRFQTKSPVIYLDHIFNWANYKVYTLLSGKKKKKKEAKKKRQYVHTMKTVTMPVKMSKHTSTTLLFMTCTHGKTRPSFSKE